MSTDEQNNNISDNTNLVSEDSDNKLLSNLFNILRTQNSDKVKSTNNNNENILLNDEEEEEDDDDEEDEDEDDDDEEDDEEEEEDDVRWDAISKLLDSHLQISKAFLHLVKAK